jgi:type IV secretory pathway VirB3-like protein
VAAPNDETIPFDRIAVAETRPTLPFGVPWLWMLVSLFGPPILVLLTFVAGHANPFWLALIPVLFFIGRLAVARDPNRPRIIRLWIMSGAALADRSQHKGDSPSHLPPADKWFGNYHG